MLWLLGATTSSVLTGPVEQLSSAVRLSAGSLGANPLALIASVLWCSNFGAYVLGTVLVLFNAHATGPLAVLRYLYTEVQPPDPGTVEALCADPAQTEDCVSATLRADE